MQMIFTQHSLPFFVGFLGCFIGKGKRLLLELKGVVSGGFAASSIQGNFYCLMAHESVFSRPNYTCIQ